MISKILKYATILVVLAFSCATTTQTKPEYISAYDRSPVVFEDVLASSLGECVQGMPGEPVYCLIAEVELELPGDSEGHIFIQQVDSNEGDNNLDGKLDFYYMLMVSYERGVFSGFKFDKSKIKDVQKVYHEKSGKRFEDNWNYPEKINLEPRLLSRGQTARGSL
jgi:hypothetical protein